MIQLSELIKVGQIGKSHGLKGEMNIAFDLDIDLEDMPYIVLDIDGIYVPFFITDYRFKNDMNALVSLEDVNDDVSARQFYNAEVFISKKFVDNIIEDEDDDSFNPRMFLGYTLVNDDKTIIGTIDDVDDATANVLYAVGDHLIPVAAIGVIDIDHDKQTIFCQLPEGLLDLID